MDSDAAEHDGWPSASAATLCSPCCSSSRWSRKRRHSRARLNTSATVAIFSLWSVTIWWAPRRAGRRIGTACLPTTHTGPQLLPWASASNQAVRVLVTILHNTACSHVSLQAGQSRMHVLTAESIRCARLRRDTIMVSLPALRQVQRPGWLLAFPLCRARVAPTTSR